MRIRPIIAFDIDGVLADFEGEFCERFGIANRDKYDLHSRYPAVDPGLISEFLTSPDVYLNLAPIFGGVEFLREFHTRGFQVVLITSRGSNLREVTEKWLNNYYIHYSELVMTNNKAEYIENYNKTNPVPIIYLVDDMSSNLENLPLGTTGLLWEQPWSGEFYPRVKYSEVDMKVLKKSVSGSQWEDFWSRGVLW